MPTRIVILGNSGSGKSTLARKRAEPAVIPTLDLDTIYWEPNKIAVARAADEARAALARFCTANASWIAEGCYGTLAETALATPGAPAPELILLNPGEEACIAHCKARPWEPHKYASKPEQDAKLAFLLDWVRDYYRRDGEMSLAGHRALFAAYDGPKRELESV